MHEKIKYMNLKTPLALYIHIPWCEKKCPYCDFNSHLARNEIDEENYIKALLLDLKTDLETYKQQINQRPLSSIFIGGGTPSLFSAQSYSILINGVREMIDLSDDIEITSEANPGSSEAAKFKGFKEAGINRLSIGVQSFNKNHLSALGRVHNPQEAINAAHYARQAGFDNFNLDLMFGLPEQSLTQSLADLKQAIDLKPSHLSCYQLTIEPNTLFHHRPPITPGDETLWEMQIALQTLLADSGYRQYEVSAYTSGPRCQHNLNYWQFGDYLGIGAGAHSKLTNANNTLTRTWKIKHPNNYLNPDKAFTGGVDIISEQNIAFEFMMNALRLSDGFSLDIFTDRTGLNSLSIQHNLEKHLALGLIDIEHQHITPTPRGKQLLDSMLQDYLVDT